MKQKSVLGNKEKESTSQERDKDPRQTEQPLNDLKWQLRTETQLQPKVGGASTVTTCWAFRR